MPVVIMECEYDEIVWVTTATSWWRAEAGSRPGAAWRLSAQTLSALECGNSGQWTQPSRPGARCQRRPLNIQCLLELEMNLRKF